MRLLIPLLVLLAMGTTTASAQCVDPGAVDVPEGFNILGGDLMRQKDDVIAYFAMGAIDATLQSSLVGADESCIAQILKCAADRTITDIVAEFLRMIIAVPSQRAQPASQIIFNAVFGDCFRTFSRGELT